MRCVDQDKGHPALVSSSACVTSRPLARHRLRLARLEAQRTSSAFFFRWSLPLPYLCGRGRTLRASSSYCLVRSRARTLRTSYVRTSVRTKPSGAVVVAWSRKSHRTAVRAAQRMVRARVPLLRFSSSSFLYLNSSAEEIPKRGAGGTPVRAPGVVPARFWLGCTSGKAFLCW